MHLGVKSLGHPGKLVKIAFFLLSRMILTCGGLLYIQRTSTRSGAINRWGFPALSVCLPTKLCEGQMDRRVSMPWIALMAIRVWMDLRNDLNLNVISWLQLCFMMFTFCSSTCSSIDSLSRSTMGRCSQHGQGRDFGLTWRVAFTAALSWWRWIASNATELQADAGPRTRNHMIL